MLVHPNFDPVALQIGPVAIRWYGLMYLVAFVLFFVLGRYRLRQPQFVEQSGLTPRMLEDVLFYGALGVVLGGRLGYVLFYKPAHFLSHPLEIPMVWQGGMSFHGGLLGVIVALAWFARRHRLAFFQVMDFVAPLVPLGLAAGRLANFINGELWGRASSLPWAMVFPQAGDNVARHPSQLYQFAGEGVLLFLILWIWSARPRARGAVSGLFLVGYAMLRFLAEFAREPDAFLGLLTFGFTMGQLLCIPMFLFGLWLLLRRPAS
ncbi:MAG TPA: prolipoprotein diacylglyceryl transferase [Burkholderiaceae bacterium]|nr:prolipoprotein diacylglyceryl transferase [Burkholderiaceae bacterium]